MPSPVRPGLVRELQTLLPDVTLVTPDSKDFEKAIYRWATLSILPAGVVAYPITTQHVSILISFASKYNLDLATCSGGHGARAISSTDGGLCIDLSKLNPSLCPIPRRTKSPSGAGCLWSEIYGFLHPHNLAIVGGVCTGVGVGGFFSLVGGYGWLTGAHGLAIDNIISVTVVLASGQIVTASSTQNADLFWALCGAGPAFGIVIEFVMQAYPQPNLVWSGALITPPKSLGTIIEVANKVMDESNKDGIAAMDLICAISDESINKELQFHGPSILQRPRNIRQTFLQAVVRLETRNQYHGL
jgi:FAD/FMN-containing dehydrogenase